jgi:hypothetical protein
MTMSESGYNPMMATARDGEPQRHHGCSHCQQDRGGDAATCSWPSCSPISSHDSCMARRRSGWQNNVRPTRRWKIVYLGHLDWVVALLVSDFLVRDQMPDDLQHCEAKSRGWHVCLGFS